MDALVRQIVLRYLQRNGITATPESIQQYARIALLEEQGRPNANAGGFGAFDPNLRRRAVKTAPPKEK